MTEDDGSTANDERGVAPSQLSIMKRCFYSLHETWLVAIPTAVQNKAALDALLP